MGDLKLYLWEGVLKDYTDGVMFAIAADVERARQLVWEDLPDYARYPYSADWGKVDRTNTFGCRALTGLLGEPEVIRGEFGFYLHGGG